MALLSFWRSNKDEVLNLTVEQVLSNAGDGNLRDHTECSAEFRHFLRMAPSERLFAYARHCLERAFEKSGLVLQDIVNELGRRLDFEVEDGLYQGKKSLVGFDGIWRFKNQPDLIIEAKTTDYVTISLDKLANYKERLHGEGKVQRDASILIVVGREDTGALEAQVRGSRYAWEMRLISVERLVKLVQIKEKSDEPATLHQIRQLLQPFEYTKIDKIIDVILTTAVDVESQQGNEDEALSEGSDHEGGKQIRTAPELIDSKRQKAIESFAALKGKELVKQSRTLFSSPDKSLRVCCVVSKRYAGDYQPYWYAYHPKWDDFLSAAKESFLVLSCMDRKEAFALPYSWLAENKKSLNMTDNGERSYWHIAVTTIHTGELAINLSKIGNKVALKAFRLFIAD
jgi:hypothetical protein